MNSTCRNFTTIVFVSLIYAIALNAVVDQKQNTGKELSTGILQFYCTSVQMKNLAKFMFHVSIQYLHFALM